MNKKNLLKIITVFILILMLCNYNVFASSIETKGVKVNSKLMNQFDDMGSTFLAVIRIVGMIVSIGGLMIIGIRYMTSSVEERALKKESMILYCIGAVLVFAIVTIVSMIYDWIK